MPAVKSTSRRRKAAENDPTGDAATTTRSHRLERTVLVQCDRCGAIGNALMVGNRVDSTNLPTTTADAEHLAALCALWAEAIERELPRQAAQFGRQVKSLRASDKGPLRHTCGGLLRGVVPEHTPT